MALDASSRSCGPAPESGPPARASWQVRSPPVRRAPRPSLDPCCRPSLGASERRLLSSSAPLVSWPSRTHPAIIRRARLNARTRDMVSWLGTAGRRRLALSFTSLSLVSRWPSMPRSAVDRVMRSDQPRRPPHWRQLVTLPSPSRSTSTVGALATAAGGLVSPIVPSLAARESRRFLRLPRSRR